MASLTLKEILIYINIRIKMLIKRNLNLIEITNNFGKKNNKTYILIYIKFLYFNKIETFQYIDIFKGELNKENIDIYINDFMNLLDNDFN